MNKQLHWWQGACRASAITITLFILIGLIGCSGGRKTPITQTTIGNTDPFDNSSLTGDTSTDFLTDNSSIDNLFDTELGAGDGNLDELNNLDDSTLQYGDVNQQEGQCLTSDQGLGFPGFNSFNTGFDFSGFPSFQNGFGSPIGPNFGSYSGGNAFPALTGYGTNTSASSNTQPLGGTFNQSSCFANGQYADPFGQYGQFGPGSFFGAGVQSYGMMNTCFQLVASRLPNPEASSQEVAMHFASAQMALVRCFREIVSWQSQIAPWGVAQQNVFRQTDHNMWFLLTLFQLK